MSQQAAGATTFVVEAVDLPTKTLSQVDFSHTAVTTEEDITDLTFTALNNDIDASLDLSVLTEDATFRVYEEVDETNIRQIKEWIWPDDNDSVNDEILKVSLIGHGVDIKVTIQSALADAQTIPIAIAEYVY